MIALSFLSLLLATTTLAVIPQKRDFQGACSVSTSGFSLPAPLTPITSPPRFTALGVGLQNYSCTSFGNYSSDGVVARLFDMSCLFGTSEFSNIENDAYNIWNALPTNVPTDSGLADQLKQNFNATTLGDHYFEIVNNTLFPVFDFTSTGPNSGNPIAIFFGNKTEDIPSPDGNVTNVDWLQLQGVWGSLANTVYQVKTVNGLPGPLNANCNPSYPGITVKYTAEYVFV